MPPCTKDPRVSALQIALQDRVPYYTGMCTIPDNQRGLYYRRGSEEVCYLDFSAATAGELDALYQACKPAEFGRNGVDVLDDSYRKAGNMDLASFATNFDPYNLGIHKQLSRALLTEGYVPIEMELCKLNVYASGDFFKAHQDTPRSRSMFGSLVVVLPALHKGGQLVLRQNGKEWNIDFTNALTTAREPSAYFVAFYGDIEHEVLPVTSGHRVTLTYNLYHQPTRTIPFSGVSTPYHQSIKQALVDLVNDKSKLPNGGYLGFGLAHKYAYSHHDLISPLPDQLKGSDRALADVCDALDLPYSFRLLYHQILEPGFSFIATTEVSFEPGFDFMNCGIGEDVDFLSGALCDMTIEQVEGIAFVGGENPKPKLLEEGSKYYPWLTEFYRDPVTEVLEVTKMELSSVNAEIPVIPWGNHGDLAYYYGTACLLIPVRPAESRELVGL